MRIGRILLSVLAVLAALALGCHMWAYWQYRGGQQASARHDFNQAQERFERCLRVWFLSSRTHLQAGRAARRAGHYDVAANHLSQGRALGGPEDALDLEFKLLRVQQGDVARTEQELESLLEQNHPDSVAILEVLTPAYIEAYQLEKAVESIDRWLALEPDTLAAWRYRAQVYSRVQNSPEELASYRRILELNPDDDNVRLQLAWQLNQARQPQAALEQYRSLRSRLGDTAQVLQGMASCLSALNQPDEARQLLEKALAQEPHNALALAERGRLAMQYESNFEAEKWLRRALAEGPAEHDLLYNLSQCLQKMGKRKEAAEIETKIKALESDQLQLRDAIRQIATNPHDPEPRCLAGQILLRNGKKDEGLRWLTSALVENPRHAPTRQALADYYLRSGDLEQAAKFRR